MAAMGRRRCLPVLSVLSLFSLYLSSWPTLFCGHGSVGYPGYLMNPSVHSSPLRPLPLAARAARGLEIAEELVGPEARELLTEFRRSYRENPYPEKLSLFFPDMNEILRVLYKSQDFTSTKFLNTVDRVFRQLHKWPSAWSGLEQLLDLRHPWTEAYCRQIIAGGYWSPFEFFYVSLDPLRPLVRYPLHELQEQSSTGFRVLERWLRSLEESEDKTTKELLNKVKEQDTMNAQEQTMRLRPLEDLLEHLLSRVLKQVLRACDSNPDAVTAIVTARDMRKRTILHVAAEQGNSKLVELLLESVTPEDRAYFAQAVDGGGYTAAHLARLAGFVATAAQIDSVGAPQTLPVALKLFPAAEGQSAKQDAGGWGEVQTGVPPAWAGDTEIDSISAGQFDWGIFEKHYVAARRPLLIRGGVRMSVSDKMKFTRQGLLEIAGSRPVRAYSTPYENDFREVSPVEMSLSDYCGFLDERDTDLEMCTKNFSYVFERLGDDEGPLSFARSPPKLFKDNIKLRSAQFTLGGQLMGSPLHYHVDAVNSLLFGKKLWFLKPPAEQEFRKTVVYEDLVKSGGPQGLRVVQESGDLLYVPQDWAHGALCMSQCIGLAHEFDVQVREDLDVPVETVNAGLGVAVFGILVFSFGIITWVVTHV